MRSSLRFTIPVLAMIAGALAGCRHDLRMDFESPYICRTDAAVRDSVYLIGDAGQPKLAGDDSSELVDPVLLALRQRVRARSEQLGPDHTAVIFLGDNIYPSGLAPKGHRDRRRGERVLDAQLAAVGEARGYFLLGNHDWDGAKEGGLERAFEQRDYLTRSGPNIEVQPQTPCPGPGVVEMGEGLRLVFGDLWSAIYHQEFPGSEIEDCDPAPGGALPAFAQAFQSAPERRVVFANHAPVITSGPHGGYFPWSEHIFPLRAINRDLWIPMPIIGSIFPLARLMGVTDTDVMSSRYSAYILAVSDLFRPGQPAITVAGHEHSLQVHVDGRGTFHAVSGAGSTRKVNYVENRRSDLMSLAAPGFMRLDEHTDGTLMLEVIALDHGDDKAVYYTCIP